MAGQMPEMFDPEQMQQMTQQLMSMAASGGMGNMGASLPGALNPATFAAAGLMPPPLPPAHLGAGNPGVMDSSGMAQAYSQMLQILQQQAALAGGGLPGGGMGMPPAPFPGMAPYSPPSASPEAVVNVSVEGMKFQYQLTEDDIQKVFCRYGAVKRVQVEDGCSSAQVTFSTTSDAQSAINDLDGKVLSGLDGTLRIKWVNQPQTSSPYPSLPNFPGLGFPQAGSSGWMGGQPGGNSPPAIPGGGMPSTPPTSGSKQGHVKGARKYTCRFLIGIENDKEFQVARRLIGSKGSNMKRIVQQTDAKLRLRGQGSGYFEGSGQKESSEPLQLCISCTNLDGYKTAVRQTEDLLKRVHEEYKEFCREKGLPVPDLQIQLSENQLIYSPRGGSQGAAQPSGMESFQPPMDGNAGMSPPKKDGKRGQRAGAKRGAGGGGKSAAGGGEGGDRGTPGPNAPPVEEIKRFINERNEARRACNFAEADRIRELLHSVGVALMDEPGARGKGSEVTTWRYWHD